MIVLPDDRRQPGLTRRVIVATSLLGECLVGVPRMMYNNLMSIACDGNLNCPDSISSKSFAESVPVTGLKGRRPDSPHKNR